MVVVVVDVVLSVLQNVGRASGKTCDL